MIGFQSKINKNQKVVLNLQTKSGLGPTSDQFCQCARGAWTSSAAWSGTAWGTLVSRRRPSKYGSSGSDSLDQSSPWM